MNNKESGYSKIKEDYEYEKEPYQSKEERFQYSNLDKAPMLSQKEIDNIMEQCKILRRKIDEVQEKYGRLHNLYNANKTRYMHKPSVNSVCNNRIQYLHLQLMNQLEVATKSANGLTCSINHLCASPSITHFQPINHLLKLTIALTYFINPGRKCPLIIQKQLLRVIIKVP